MRVVTVLSMVQLECISGRAVGMSLFLVISVNPSLVTLLSRVSQVPPGLALRPRRFRHSSRVIKFSAEVAH